MRARGEGGISAGSRATRVGATLALLAALVLAVNATAAGAASTTSAASAATGRARGHAKFRVHRLCGKPRPGAAACLGMKLVPAALSSADLHANAVRQSREAATGALPAVANKSPEPGYLTPQRLRAAYDLPDETSSSLLQTIALVDAFDDPRAEADLAVFDTQFGLPPCTSANGCLRKVNESGAAGPLPAKEGGWASEISIDVQMAHAICPSCRILLVEASSEEFSDLGTAVNTAVDLGATVVSNSYGGPEQHSYASLAAAYYEHPGTLVAASSGDCGYLNKACPGEPAAANFPADSEHVLAVGGTSLSESKGVWTSTVWGEGGSGCSKYFSAPPWQSAVADFSATGCGSGRSVADVSAIGDPETGVDVYDSTPDGEGDPTGWGVWGGTSVSSPIVAGEFALAGGPRGVAYPAATVYAHQGENSALYDVVSGSNGKCAGTTECAGTAGYDGPTGVGSPLGLSAFSIAGAPEAGSPPVISGVAEQGRTLEASAGQWSGEPSSRSGQWARCDPVGSDCAPIFGATGSTYAVSAADVGSTIRLQETAANVAGEGAPAVSVATALVASIVPTIERLTPAGGITGSSFTIEGSGLGAASEVTLGKLAASFTVRSSTQIEAIVPNGAKAGKVSVVAPGGTASTKSKFTPTLAVTSFGPKHGAVGKLVTVKGVGFAPGAAVSFDGVGSSSVSYVSSTTLKAVVPAGAATGPISVSNSSAPLGTVTSAASFDVP